MQRSLNRAIEAHTEEALTFLGELVHARSTVGFEQHALEIFAREATSLGLEVERLPFSNGPIDDARAGVAPKAGELSPDRFQVLATTAGEGELLVLLNGHIDVVPAECDALWTTTPFELHRRDGWLHGRGAADMKSGFAIGMLALRALRDVVPDLFAARRLGFLAVVEEECTGNGTLRSIVEHGVTAPEVIVLEPTNLGLLVGGVGVLWIDIGVVASSGHAQVADVHPNAIDLGMRLVEALRHWAAAITRSQPEPSMAPDAKPYAVNLGKVRSGDWTSTSPSHALFSLRIGFPRAWTPTEAEAAVRQAIAAFVASDPGFPTQPTVTLTGFRAKGYLLDPETPLVRDLAAAHRAAHGSDPAIYTLGSTTDARTYVNDFAVPAVCFGAVGRDLHGIDESVHVQSIVDAAQTLSRFLLKRFAPLGAAQ